MISPKMKSCWIQTPSLILVVLIAQPALAGVVPGRWEKVSAMELASPIKGELKNGDRIKGQFRGLSSSDLELLNPAGRAVIPKTDIQTITPDYSSHKHKTSKCSRHVASDQRVTGYPQKKIETRRG